MLLNPLVRMTSLIMEPLQLNSYFQKMKLKRKMFFGWLNLTHILSQGELDKGERGGTET